MSLIPDSALPDSGSEPVEHYLGTPAPERGQEPQQPRRLTALQRLWRALFAVFAFEIGAFLLIYPWMDSWNLNHLPTQFRNFFMNLNLEDLWDDPYFRGAVSGLGLINVWIALAQAVRIVKPRQTL